MTQEDKDYLDSSKLWLDGLENIDKELDLEIEFSKQEISIRAEAIAIADKRKEINRKQRVNFKAQIVNYCNSENIELPDWI